MDLIFLNGGTIGCLTQSSKQITFVFKLKLGKNISLNYYFFE